jgi:hypothetical protein
MSPETNGSLLALERELGRLRSAVDHIDEAKSAARQAVDVAGTVQQRYAAQLEGLVAEHRRQLDELTAHTRKMVAALKQAHDRQLADLERVVVQNLQGQEQHGAAARAAHERRLTELAEVRTRDVAELVEAAALQAKDISAAFARLAAESREAHAQQLADLGETHARQVAEVRAAHTRLLAELAQNHGRQSAELAQVHARSAIDLRQTLASQAGQVDGIFNSIRQMHEKHTADIERHLLATQTLIVTSATLVKRIDDVDFPARLKRMDEYIASVDRVQQNIRATLEAMQSELRGDFTTAREEIEARISRMEKTIDQLLRAQEEKSDARFQKHLDMARVMKYAAAAILLLQAAILTKLFF